MENGGKKLKVFSLFIVLVSKIFTSIFLLNLCLYLTTLCSTNAASDIRAPNSQLSNWDEKYERGTNFWNAVRNLSRSKRASNNFCVFPPPSIDKSISYKCYNDDSHSCVANGTVPDFTVANISCNPGYSSLKDTGNKFQSVCLQNSWIPPIDKCYKICDKLNPVNVDLECFRKDVRISCDESSLTTGVRVRPTCKQLYTYKDVYPTYQEIVCGEDGKWNKPLFSCIPECGRQFEDATTLITGGRVEHFGDSPWHVAIYDQNKVLICGGTIVTTDLIVSAAHCFYDNRNKVKLNPENYEVVVSKFTRNYSIVDNPEQRIHKIKEIRFSERGFVGLDNYFAADIAILILSQPIIISRTVLPACVYWTRSRQNPIEGTLAKVVGWGKNEKGVATDTLMTTNLPYIGRLRCLNTVPDDFKAFVTFDKFCAGSETGSGVLQGDSGGGLMFQESNFHYYIRGIVSLKQPTTTAIAAFTNLDDHIDWIIKVRNEVEQIRDKSEQTRVNQTSMQVHANKTEQETNKTTEHVPSKVEQECGYIPANSNDSPWHVNLYTVGSDYIDFGGTIISPRLILSVFSNLDHSTISSCCPNAYEIVPSKYSRNQKSYKIQDFRYSLNRPNETVESQAEHTLIIILAEKLTFNSDVYPACVDWTLSSRFDFTKGTSKVVKYRKDSIISNKLTVPNSLLIAESCRSRYKNTTKLDPIFDYQFCLEMGRELDIVTSTMGSGVMFEKDSRYFIRGIVSYQFSFTEKIKKLKIETAIAIVTDIAIDVDWIKSIRNEIDP